MHFDFIGSKRGSEHVSDVTASRMVHDAIVQKKRQFRVSPKTLVYVMRELVKMDTSDCAFIRLTLKPRHIPYSCGRAGVRFSSSGPLNMEMSPSGIFEVDAECCIQIHSLDRE